VQAGISGRYNIARTAESDLTDLMCSPPNPSFFCDRRVDAHGRHLKPLEQDSAARADLVSSLSHPGGRRFEPG
jgi:hypothetical protein